MRTPPRPTVLALALCLAAAPATRAQRRGGREAVLEPQPLRLAWGERYLRMEGEWENERVEWPDGLGQEQRIQEFRPSLGLGFSGSVYHPNLLDFRGATEWGITEGSRRMDALDTVPADEDRGFQSQRYDLSADFLREKPWAIGLHGRQSRDRRSYDAFRTHTTEDRVWGGRLRLPVAGMPGDLTFEDHREDELDPERPVLRTEQTMRLQMRRNADNGAETRVQAGWQQFRQREPRREDYEGESTHVDLSRHDHFGGADRVESHASLRISDLQTSMSDRRHLTVREDLTARLRPTLESGARYLFDLQEEEGATAAHHELDAHLEHRLFESLVSTAGAEARLSRRDGGGVDEDQYGPYLSEAYQKRVGGASLLRLRAEGRWLRQRRTAEAGDLAVRNETIRLDGAGPRLLAEPDLRPGSLRLTDASATTLYREGRDYRLIPRGDRTELQRIPGGTIPEGGEVRADYRTDSAGNASSDLVETGASAEFAWHDRLVVVRAQTRRLDNQAAASGVYPDDADTTLGLEFNPGGLALLIERVDHRGDTLRYEGTRASAQYTRQISTLASVLVDASRESLTYADPESTRETTRAGVTLQVRPRASLGFALRGTWFREDEGAFEREWTSAEWTLDHTIGRLTTSCVLRLEEDADPGEDRNRRYAYVRATRQF